MITHSAVVRLPLGHGHHVPGGARLHLGVESRRQWSDLVIPRTPPALLGVFSLITLWAAEAEAIAVLHPRSSAWYTKDKEPATFSDAIAAVRRVLWDVRHALNLSTSRQSPDIVKIPAAIPKALTDALRYATSDVESRANKHREPPFAGDAPGIIFCKTERRLRLLRRRRLRLLTNRQTYVKSRNSGNSGRA